MKIGHLISTYLPVPGGAQVCVHNIARRHAVAGHGTVVVVPGKFAGAVRAPYAMEPLAPATVAVSQRSFSAGKAYLGVQLAALQKKHRFDLWQVTIGHPLGTSAVEFFRERNIPCVLRCSGDDIQVNDQLGYGMRRDLKVDRLVRRQYPLFDRCVAISQSMKDEYLGLGVSAQRVTVIPNGVDLGRFQDEKDPRELRRQYGLPSDKRIILTVGRNHPKKGFSLIPAALRWLVDKGVKDVHWVLVGEGNDPVLREARERGVADHVTVLPTTGLPRGGEEYPSRELIDIYRACDIFAFPTYLETFGIVAVEAMAAGLPVVTTAAPGVDEIVQHGRSGFKVRPGDAAGMAEYLSLLLDDDRRYREIRAGALQASQAYDWNGIAQKYLEMYQTLCPSPR